jgi:hypothetical protein
VNEHATKGEERAAHWVELGSTILIAVAAVATAWSGYESTRWSGEQAIAFSSANATRLESTRASALANAQTQVDVAVFTQWVNAFAREEAELRDFYFERFRDEFKPAVEAWIATRPRENPDAPLSPFAMPEYRLAAGEEADRLEAEATGFAELARRNNQRSDNYVLAVVLFALALFFAGISTRLPTVRARLAILGLGWVAFVVTVVWVATFPVSFST